MTHAQQISEAETDHGGSRTQPSLREEDGYPSEGGEGVQQGRPEEGTPEGEIVDELLRHILEVLEEIKDTHENLETLEKLFSSFSKVQHAALRERQALRQEISREQATAVRLRLRLANSELVARLCLKLYLQCLVQFCAPLDMEGWGVLLRAKSLGWIEQEDMPTPPDAHETSDAPKVDSEKD